ncbi:hypothetical protein BO86DRAFT_245713 [Aspergillus japonicus CBS 114.51]|uniref:Methyltransferase type 11 domain-containing protein n=1 Tax=Aspergillus japonicus CBS 114.51 TaxID=1448312 RepID=A0A8T8WLU4_ASPJA|nr:hypothetical protein BO86DRAFT_245713 [Aspergillus japonicus CBS 114.51]RAH76747.1 hypothetical protein BO86DRAFT_245713 [Aspergillus japonicus CBS 114.51]
MADMQYSTASGCPPLRQVRGTRLDTIPEDYRETQYTVQKEQVASTSQKSATIPRLKLKTSGLSSGFPRPNRFFSPISAGSVSSCSDTEWQQQMKPFEDLYDATDEESVTSDECTSFASTRPTSLTTPTTRNSMLSPISRKRYPSLAIPPSPVWPSLQGACKSSPIPPTPPSKIPVSPAALSMLGRSVPAVHAPPSLDGSISSDQVSNLSAPATPDLQSIPDQDWPVPGVHVRPDLEDVEDVGIPALDADPDVQSIEIAFDAASEDLAQVLGRFPRIPGQVMPPAYDMDMEPDLVRGDTPSDTGVHLPEDAMETLRHLSLNRMPDPWSESSDSNDEMWQVETPPQRPRSADGATPASELSGYSFSRLSIPSPGGFFASLAPRARHTWAIPNGNKPPNSATAERFYKLPFPRAEGEIVEQVIDYPERATDEELTAVYDPSGPPTAIRIPAEHTIEPLDTLRSPVSTIVEEMNHDQMPAPLSDQAERDEDYEAELKKKAMSGLDRTSVWLAAQASYLAALNETNPANSIDKEGGSEIETPQKPSQQAPSSLARKRSAKFTGVLPAASSSQPSALASKDSIYWRGFQALRGQSSIKDIHVHQHARFDAVQSVRVGMPGLHVDCLMGKYELIPTQRPAYKGPFSMAPRNSTLDSARVQKAQFSIVEKEQLVLSQIRQAMWAMDALRFLNGGRMLISPASRKLRGSNRSPKTSAKANQCSFRVLDLGGHASCEWAWQFAYDYPDAKVTTVYTGSQEVNRGIKGPPNHRHVFVSQPWKLPFPDNKFDVISARSLPALLKKKCPSGEILDEYDLCLQECRRCLKPGGYLEYFVLDAEISHSGPQGSAISEKFVANLQAQGYDPMPTKSWLGHVQKHFADIKRAWAFLPMGIEPTKTEPPRETPDPRVKSLAGDYEAIQGPVGSTADIASITGLLGGWFWEQWCVKLQQEIGIERENLLAGVGAVFDEGRKNGAGWTCLSGWAMKPRCQRRRGGQPKGKGVKSPCM